MASITARLFEDGTITGGDGFNSVVGSPTVDTTSKMKGVNCARTTWTGSANVNGSITGLSATEFYTQFYINVAAYPSSTSRMITSNNGSTQWNMTITGTGSLNLRHNTTTIMTGLINPMTIGTTYRVGIYFKKETTLGAGDGILRAWAAVGDTAFSGTPSYENTAYSMNASANAITTLVFGQNSAAAATGDIYFDDIKLDDAVMPNTGSSTDTPKSITLSVTSTIAFGPKTVGKPITIAVTTTKSILRAISFIRALVATITLVAIKAKPILVALAVSSAATVQKTIGKPISVAVTSAITFSKGVGTNKFITYAVTSALTFAKGNVSLKMIAVTVTTTKSVVKNIGKPILRTVIATLTRITNIPKNVLLSVTVIKFLQKDYAFTKVLNIVTNVMFIGGQLYYKTADIIVNTSLLIHKNILKPITVIQSVIVSLAPKNIGKAIITTVTGIVTAIHGNALFKDITVVVSTVVNRVIGISKTINVVQGTIVTIQRSFTLLKSVLANAPVVLTVHKRMSLVRSVVVDSFVSFSKLLQDQYTNTPFHKNVRALTLSIKNSTLSILGKNTRTISLRDTDES